MSDNLRLLPNYTCLMTVQRSSKRFGGETFLNHDDTIRLEVAEVGDKEFFGWPGTALTDPRTEDFCPRWSFRQWRFCRAGEHPVSRFRCNVPPDRKEKIAGHEAVGYAYEVTRANSHYELTRAQASACVRRSR